MIPLFWFIFSIIFYCYFGYPFLLLVLANAFPKRVNKVFVEPSVSIILSVWNEEDVIEQKIKNILSTDYPLGKMEILIGSDGSTDKTNDIIKKFLGPRIRLVEEKQRRGKMATINRLVQMAQNEIVVFTDARQEFSKNAIGELAANFADSKVGCVSGELLFLPSEGATGKGVDIYWRYEKFIRKHESRLGSILGATGAIYAIRRDLFVQIPQNVVLDDMFIPFKIIQRGFRAIFDSEARAYDKVAETPEEEHRRKARTLYGNYQIFSLFPELFIPFKSPIAFQLFSHKFLRVSMPFFLIAFFALNLFLLDMLLYNAIFSLQVAFYVMAVIGLLFKKQNYGILKCISRICAVPYVFCLLNFSALTGLFRFLFFKQDIMWQKARK